MLPLQRLWQAIEATPGAIAVLTEWRDRLGADFPLFQPMLLPTDRFAESIPVANDPYVSYRVVWHAPDDIVGIHDGGGPQITLSKRDVLIYRLDFHRLGREIAIALGIEQATANVNDVPNLHRIGSCQSVAGSACPAYLVLPLDAAELRRAVEWIVVQHNEPFILLAPTARHMRLACEQMLKQRKSCFLTLAESIEVNGDGKWSATEAARRRLLVFLSPNIPLAEVDGSGIALVPASDEQGIITHAVTTVKRVKDRITIAMRSWTQPDLNAAIIEYKAKRASTYQDLVAGVKAGRPGAKKSAQQMFGRNAISRELGVRAKAMVSKSPEWLAIAEELQLSHGKDRNKRKLAKVGLDIAIEARGADASQTVLDIAIQNETIRLVRASLPNAEAAALIEKLQCGEITDEHARMVVDVVKEQKRDDRTRKVRSVS
jgi:hypothetical protein